MPLTFLIFLCATGAVVIIAGFLSKDEPIDHIEPDDLMDTDYAKARQMADRIQERVKHLTNHSKNHGAE